ncbi:hypothetical protein [Stieleria marina]|uniref:hypothetical protein n=1 Tax=Stieleria marina TaxID=1930275 RepID=UPI003AF365A9
MMLLSMLRAENGDFGPIGSFTREIRLGPNLQLSLNSRAYAADARGPLAKKRYTM